MKINLGCGGDIRKGFLNIDFGAKECILDEETQIINYDLTQGLPDLDLLGRKIELDYVYSSHFIEHIKNDKALNLMQCCFDKMKPGGIFRTALPNFKKAFQAYLNNDLGYFSSLKKFAPNDLIIEYIEYAVYQFGQHVSLWDEEKAIFYLKKVGFNNIKISQFDENYDINRKLRIRYSFYIEAVK